MFPSRLNKMTKTNIPPEVKTITQLQSKLSASRTQGRAETPTAMTRDCKTSKGVKRWRLRGAFSQICWGFTTQVNITCSLACHNSWPMAPRARQQATVSQEAQTGPTLHRWGRYAAERERKKKEYSQKRCWCWKAGCGLMFKRLKVVCHQARRCAGWTTQRDSSTEAENSFSFLAVMEPDRSACFAELFALTNRWTWLQWCVCALVEAVPIAIKKWALWILSFPLSATRCFLACRPWRQCYSGSRLLKSKTKKQKMKRTLIFTYFILISW